MVHLNFPKPVSRASGHSVIPTAQKMSIGPSRTRVRGEDLIEMRKTALKVSNNLPGRPAGTILDLFSPLFRTAFVLWYVFTSNRTCQTAGVSVSVPRQVSQDVSNTPVGKSAWRSGFVIRQGHDAVQEAGVRFCAQLGRTFRIVLKIHVAHAEQVARRSIQRHPRNSWPKSFTTSPVEDRSPSLTRELLWHDVHVTVPLKLTINRELEAAREAARIWALAKARRDQNSAPDPVEKTLPGIQRRLDVAGSELILAARGDSHVGFTLFAPRGGSLEIFYLAVAPDSWGSGVAGALLASVEKHARDVSRATLDLWVISDNERAISVYKRAGFIDTEQLQHDDSSGRTERRMIKELG